jgi:hypothetical protein
MVPPEVGAMIKKHKYFGYCEPEPEPARK